MMKQTFGEVIQRLREAKSWSVYALAQRAGLSDQAIHDLERDRRQPSFDTARRLAAALDTTLDGIANNLPPVELPEPTPGRPRGRPPKATGPTSASKRTRKYKPKP
jgi:transcriptional regulator with XRE-family HTH domain